MRPFCVIAITTAEILNQILDNSRLMATSFRKIKLDSHICYSITYTNNHSKNINIAHYNMHLCIKFAH